MRGSLHCATDDRAVCRFGRDDVSSYKGQKKGVSITTARNGFSSCLHGWRVVGIDVVGIDFRLGVGCGLGIHQVAKFLGWLEEGNLLGGNIDLLAGLGVATDAGVSLASAEAAEAADLDLVA